MQLPMDPDSLAFAMIAFSMFPIHWELSRRINKQMSTAFVALFLSAFPYIWSHLQQKNYGPYVLAYLIAFLRISETGLLDELILIQWSLKEYLIYIILFVLPDIKLKDKSISQKHGEAVDKHRIPYAKLHDRAFMTELACNSALKFIFYVSAFRYLRHSRPNWNPEPYSINGFSAPWKDRLDYYLLGNALAMMLDLSTISMVLVSYFTKLPFLKVMKNPAAATSIKNFWGVRWNYIVHRTLRVLIFDPTITFIFGHTVPMPKGKRIPALHTMLAGFATFVFSGLMHEWVISLMCDGPMLYEQMLYFIVTGMMSISEVVVQKLVLSSFGIDLANSIPYPVQLIYTTLANNLIAPLFMNPLIRQKTFFTYSPF